MRDQAIQNALKWHPEQSVSDGNILVGASPTHVAVNFNNTPGQENTMIILRRVDAAALLCLLQSILDKVPPQ